MIAVERYEIPIIVCICLREEGYIARTDVDGRKEDLSSVRNRSECGVSGRGGDG